MATAGDRAGTAGRAGGVTVRLGMTGQWYDPEGGSAAVAGASNRSLAGLEHELHVLTGLPDCPTRKVYPDYRIRPDQYGRRAAGARS